jgi:hypothetical protein
MCNGITVMRDVVTELLDAGVVRHDKINVLHIAGNADAQVLAKLLIGRRCKKFAKEYEITSINYGYDGYITARGYRILGNGKRGTQTWDIGAINTRAFE